MASNELDEVREALNGMKNCSVLGMRRSAEEAAEALSCWMGMIERRLTEIERGRP